MKPWSAREQGGNELVIGEGEEIHLPGTHGKQREDTMHQPAQEKFEQAVRQRNLKMQSEGITSVYDPRIHELQQTVLSSHGKIPTVTCPCHGETMTEETQFSEPGYIMFVCEESRCEFSYESITDEWRSRQLEQMTPAGKRTMRRISGWSARQRGGTDE